MISRTNLRIGMDVWVVNPNRRIRLEKIGEILQGGYIVYASNPRKIISHTMSIFTTREEAAATVRAWLIPEIAKLEKDLVRKKRMLLEAN